MASIVEKEGVIAKNMGPVARVIFNRLANDMPLQMDSTVLYAEGRDGGPVTAADLQPQTPYNTYLNKGLTPTPICFPSPAALQAALAPAGRVVALLRGGQAGRHRGLRRHLRRAAGQRGAGRAARACPERRRDETAPCPPIDQAPPRPACPRPPRWSG